MNKIICFLFGHKWVVVGEYIHTSPRLVEQDRDCSVCGLKVTNVE